jgi:hypothetical protein
MTPLERTVPDDSDNRSKSMSRRSLIVTGVGWLLSLILAFTAFWYREKEKTAQRELEIYMATFPVRPPGPTTPRSPIVVHDGSICADTGNGLPWSGTGTGPYSARVASTNDPIVLTGFQPAAVPISDTGGWSIVILNSKSTPNAIALCSGSPCRCTGQNCPAGTPGDGKSVYLSLPSPGMAVRQTNQRLQFEDDSSSLNCPPGSSFGEGPCDRISKVTVTTQKNVTFVTGSMPTRSMTFTCSSLSYSVCRIEIGQ